MRKIAIPITVLALLAGSIGALQTIHAAKATAVPVLSPGTTPHYFGPFANYANSPQRMSDAVINFSGGGGSGAGAVATVDPATGAIKSFNVTQGGTGYTSAPTVGITSPVAGGTGAAATATVARGVTHITVTNGGTGYIAPPAITISGGTGATATPNMSGFVGSIDVGLGGSGYAHPTVQIEAAPAGGVTATATATVVGGAITAINVVNRGSGYTTEPSVIITEGNNNGAVARANVVMNTIDSIDVNDSGAGYTSAAVTIGAPSPGGTQATATAAVSGAVTGVTVVSPGSGYVTPSGIKKFVDTLPGLGSANPNDLGQYIPIAKPDTTTYPGSEYYEIAVVQYREKMHRDLPPTLLRGYVQLSTTAVPGAHVALTNANINPALPPTPITLNGQQVYGVDSPHSYGPLIQATKDRPVRVLFRDLLPTGVAGDLFLPVDTTIMGSGRGAALSNAAEPNPQRPICGNTPKPVGCYTENRATLHLHGGITPWISDGTPHQWITPAGESALYPKGVSVSNVPDMPDPGPGAQTFFYTNQESARMLFYHDHSFGITRLNVYAGEASGYLITDPKEKALVASGTIPSDQIPLILADKTFVPSDAALAQQDPTWDKSKWGGEGNLWMPHVYMPIQNPSDSSGSNPFGRWQYGPWFWPPTAGIKYPPKANPYFDPNCDSQVTTCEPAQIPAVPDVSMGMEAFNDTPTVNGTAYPTTTLQPKSYRFRILNAADDRYFNLQMYKADSTGTEVALDPAALAAEQNDPTVVPTPDTKISTPGPSWMQIGTEGGFLPAPVIMPNQPITWVTDAGRFDAGNVDKHALLVGPAERADVVVDFSKYAGQTLDPLQRRPGCLPVTRPEIRLLHRRCRPDRYRRRPDDAARLWPEHPHRHADQDRCAPVALPFNYSRLQTAFAHHTDGSGVFESSQNPIIVGQGALQLGVRDLVPHGSARRRLRPHQRRERHLQDARERCGGSDA